MAGMIIAALPFAFHFGIFSKEIEATKEVKEILVFIILITICIVLFLFIKSSFSKNDGFLLFFMPSVHQPPLDFNLLIYLKYHPLVKYYLLY